MCRSLRRAPCFLGFITHVTETLASCRPLSPPFQHPVEDFVISNDTKKLAPATKTDTTRADSKVTTKVGAGNGVNRMNLATKQFLHRSVVIQRLDLLSRHHLLRALGRLEVVPPPSTEPHLLTFHRSDRVDGQPLSERRRLTSDLALGWAPTTYEPSSGRRGSRSAGYAAPCRTVNDTGAFPFHLEVCKDAKKEDGNKLPRFNSKQSASQQGGLFLDHFAASLAPGIPLRG
ncbi:hypothetical protein B0T16DRAFT_236067 [Cercophora newfieldiana]|uniref:Uncharacterized protein n=1 Tax=Cercophora newfieldiana TaxID=92897 RepID=A0AA39XSV8_9PEZI|nr:hypothetical protein B0T16DRAFT_236067 [Cercophora newfieldiana]